jgi:hypothetical protein
MHRCGDPDSAPAGKHGIAIEHAPSVRWHILRAKRRPEKSVRRRPRHIAGPSARQTMANGSIGSCSLPGCIRTPSAGRRDHFRYIQSRCASPWPRAFACRAGRARHAVQTAWRGSGSQSWRCLRIRAPGCFQFLFLRQREPPRRQPVNMSGRQTRARGFLPGGFQQTLFAETHEQGIERAGFQARLLGKVISVPPELRAFQKDRQQGTGLMGIVLLARHCAIFDICRVLSRALLCWHLGPLFSPLILDGPGSSRHKPALGAAFVTP